MTGSFLLPGTIIGYIVAIVFAALYTIYRSPAAHRSASILFVLTWALHTATVVREALALGRLPLASGAEYLLSLGWIVLSLHLVLWFRMHVEIAGLVLPPLAGAMTFAAMQLGRPLPADTPFAPDGWFLLHTTVSTLGMAILCVAFSMSVIYLVQDRALKSRQKLLLLERLPSLHRADQIGFRALTAGFLLLTLGIGTGIVVNAEMRHRILVLEPKQVLPLLAWLVFASGLAARGLLGLRGRKTAYLTITGVALGLATVIGMTL
jgi:ABC-type uncharacterized transport system permease subunit